MGHVPLSTFSKRPGIASIHELSGRGLLGNSKGQGRKKKKKKEEFGVTDSASLLSIVFVVG
jgi:hypothetical protein